MNVRLFMSVLGGIRVSDLLTGGLVDGHGEGLHVVAYCRHGNAIKII